MPAHTTDEIKIFAKELNKQTDRGAGIVASAVLEEALEYAIRQRLRQLSNTRAELLFGRMRPLSSFSAKIELGAAIGLYDDRLRAALNAIRDARNEFAHNMEASGFDYPAIAKIIQAAHAPGVPASVSLRDRFMVMFQAAILLLYAEGATDIRIKSLGETHPQIFTELAVQVHAFQQTQASTRTKPSGSQGSQEPKPKGPTGGEDS